MSTSASKAQAQHKIVSIKALQRLAEADAAGRAVGEIRRQLSLLQGYADLAEGLSPRQTREILKVMSEKIHDLTVALRPFTTQRTGQAIDRYLAIRARQMQLLADHRSLVSRLKENLGDSSAPEAPVSLATTASRRG